MAVWRTTVRTDYPGTGGPGFSTFHFRDDADGDVTAALQAATDALENAYQPLGAVLGPGRLMGTDGRWIEVDGDRLEDVDGWSVPGSAGGTPDSLPPATTLVVSWGTASNSRSGRGRTFLSGFDEFANTGGVPNATVLTPARALGSRIVDFNATLGNGAFVIYSRTQEISRDITRSNVNPQWAVLRSRRD